MIDYMLNFIFIYLIIGIPIMLYKFQDLNASLQQLYFNWFCWPVVVLKYIKDLWKK